MRAANLIWIAASVSLVAGCSPESAEGYEPGSCEPPSALVASDEALRLVTTVAPLTDIVSVVTAGTPTEVTGLVPAGVNSHTFEPSPSMARVLEAADAVLLNGLGLESPTLDLAEANLSDEGVICLLGDEVLPVDDYRFDFSFPESGGVPNPHLWTNPSSVERYVEVLVAWLDAADPARAPLYVANGDAFTQRIAQLGEATATAVATIAPADRSVLTYHDAYAYFAEEFGFTVVGAVQPSSFSEPTPRDVARLLEQIDETGVRVIFGSEVFPSPVLEQLAAEAEVRYVDDLRDDVLPGDPGDPEHTWFGMMRFNTITMVEALGGDASALHALPVG